MTPLAMHVSKFAGGAYLDIELSLLEYFLQFSILYAFISMVSQNYYLSVTILHKGPGPKLAQGRSYV